MTKLKIKYNPFAKAFKDTKVKSEEKDRREPQDVYQPALGYGIIHSYSLIKEFYLKYICFFQKK